VLHAVGEEGVPLRDIADAIGRKLDLAVTSITPEQAADQFGFLAGFQDATTAAITAAHQDRTTRRITATISASRCVHGPVSRGMCRVVAHCGRYAILVGPGRDCMAN
jgi:hypothetical protein